MPSSYTTSLRLTLPATGELAGQWGNTVNTGITELLDAAVAGTTTISTWGGAGVSYTLSNNSGSADEARRMFIVATGTPGEAKNVICPAVSKFYVFRNDTTGGFALTLKTPSGTGVSVPAGQYRFLYCDGTNVVEMFNSVGSLTVIGALNAGSVNATTLDLTNLEVTNIKAKDGTASMTLADATGVATFSANPILNAGTANGVLYLNGSKVATSGNTLTFDGTTLSSVGSGDRARFGTGSRNIFIAGDSGGVSLFDGAGQTGNGWYINGASNFVAGYIGSSEQMRLTSTGLGIGTSSPVARLHVAAGNLLLDNARVFQFRNAAGTARPVLTLFSDNNLYIDSEDGAQIFRTLGTERMRLDTSGNLGIGTSSPGAKLDVQGSLGSILGQFFENTSGQNRRIRFSISSNVGTIESTATTGATNLAFAVDGFERMRITSAGDVGIGTSSPATTLHVQSATGQVRIQNTTSGTALIGFRNSVTTDIPWVGTGGDDLRFITLSTERMRLDTSGNLGIGTSSPAEQLTVGDVNDRVGLYKSGTITQLRLGSSVAGTAMMVLQYDRSTGTYQFSEGTNGNTGSPDIAVLAGGNVGIGTSSPGNTLDVNGVIRARGDIFAMASGDRIQLLPQSAGNGGIIATANSAFSAYSPMTLDASLYVWRPNGSEQMRLDASGNLGIGTSSPASRLDVSGNTRSGAASGNNTAEVYSGANRIQVWAGGATGILTNADFRIGDLAYNSLLTVVSTSGNVGIGTTSPSQPLEVRRDGASSTCYIGSVNITATGSSGGAGYFARAGSNFAYFYVRGDGVAYIDNATANPLGFAVNGTERARITSGGDLLVGTTTTAGTGITVKGTYYARSADQGSVTALAIDDSGVATLSAYRATGGTLTFVTANTSGGNTERARITSGGILLVGKTTSSGGSAGIELDPVGQVVATRDGGASGYFNRLTSDGSLISMNRSNVEVGTISVTTTATAYNTSSDYRLKDNPQPLTGSGAFIDALQPKTWNWKVDGSKGVGFIAHEAQAVSPSSVTGTKDAVDADGKPVMQAMEYGSAEFIANIIAELQSLRARVAALESQP